MTTKPRLGLTAWLTLLVVGAMLPLLVFLRAYSNLYLAQFGTDYDVFNPRIPPGRASVPAQ